MLTLIYGNDWTANRAQIMDLLAADIANKRPGRILLVPELISHDTERRLCRIAGDTSSRYAEVLSFSRLTKRICDWANCAVVDCLDKGGRLVAMAAAARGLHHELKAYASVETKPEFLTGLIDAIDEFKRCCITPEDLKAASVQTQGAFAQKLEELSLLLQTYDAICQQGKRDPRDQLTWGIEQLMSCDFAQNHVFYIDGFPDFTIQNMTVLEHLIVHSPQVIISLNCDVPGSEELAFSKAGDTASKILRIARDHHVDVKLCEVSVGTEKFLPVCQRLFQGKTTYMPEYARRLRIVQADTVYDECVLAVEQILELVQNGARYRDISVVCADLGSYQSILQMQLQLSNIPVYIAGTDDILEKSVIVTVLAALDAALSGFETKDILKYLKSALSPLDLDDCDQLENYALLWNIQGKKWLEEWTMHPDGLQDIWTQDHTDQLTKLNNMRRFAMEPLRKLSNAFHSATRLEDQVQGLSELLDNIHLQERLAGLAVLMDQAGDNRSAQIMNQLWEILLSALEQLRDVLGNTNWDNESFSRLFKLLLSQYDVGTIPPVLDTLMVGPVSAMRCQEVRHLIIIGAGESHFPGYGSAIGVLSDNERKILRQIGVPLTGGASEGLEIEFSEIYSAFCGASDSVYVSCPSGQTSFVYRRLAEMVGGEYTAQNVLGAAAVNKSEAAAYLGRIEAADAAYELGIEDTYRSIMKKAEHTLGNVSHENVAGIYGSKLNLSASQIDTHADCRLSYFLKYGLRAKEQRPVSVDPAEFGTYVHAVLEQTARQIKNMGGFKSVTLEETLQIAQKYADEYAQKRFSQIDSQRISYLFHRNSRELMMIVEELWNELQQSSFAPVDFEVAFGDQSLLPAIPIPGENMDAQLRGFVDRVDSWKEDGRNYFRVVDYKTGKKDFDYCDVFNGLGLQMLLYLFSLEQAGEPLLGNNPIPAGVQYFPARVPIVSADAQLTDEEAQKERQSSWKRKGIILEDDDVLRAMEDTDTPTRLCCRRKKDGTVTGDIASREQFKLLSRYVFALLGKMVDEIAAGNISPNPYTRGSSHNACRFCPYGAVCHAAVVEGRRNYKAMSSQRFWDEIGKEMSKNE